MTTSTRTELLDTLADGWGRYVARFRALPPDAQTAWVAKQGYARFADVLAHVTAWWAEGQRTVENFVANPDFLPPDYDETAFNAQAVAQYAALDEDAVIDAFERRRAQWVVLISGLSDAAIAVPKIADRLHIEIVGHLAEHQLP